MNLPTIPHCSISGLKLEREAYLQLAGAMRLTNGEAIKNAILPQMDESIDTLYLNLRNLTELDSAGLGHIVGLHMTARKRKVNLKLVAPTAFVAKLFETTKLNSVLTIVNGTEAVSIVDKFEANA